MTDQGASAAAGEGRQAGRGVLYIAGAKFYFMGAGAAIEFALPRLLSVAVFGAYGLVASWVSPVNNVIITGTILAVSRSTAQRPERAREIQRAGYRLHLVLGLPLAIAFVVGSPIAAYLFKDQTKTEPFMLAGVIVAAYAFYAVFVGTANGRKQFHVQAGLDVTMATLRAAGILGMAAAGLGVAGAIGGWLGAAGVILVVSTFVVGLPGRSGGAPREPLSPMMRYFLAVAVYLLLFNLVMVVDTWLLKALSFDWFAARGAAEPAILADEQVGFYRAVQNLARLPYQAIVAVTFVIFPLISRATFAQDRETTRGYIHTTVRYSLIVAAAMALVFAANPEPMLDFVYPTLYAEIGGPALVALALGTVAFAVFAIAGTILNGAGLTRQAVGIAGFTLTLTAAGNWIVIPRFEPGPDLLLACASATAGSMLVGAVLGGLFLRRHLGAFLPLASLLRVAVAAAVAVAVGRAIPLSSKLGTLIEAAIVGLTFLTALAVTRELTGTDVRRVASIARRRKEIRS
jgi:O-antigen/teichoic acid export membrane protein